MVIFLYYYTKGNRLKELKFKIKVKEASEIYVNKKKTLETLLLCIFYSTRSLVAELNLVKEAL